MDRPDPVLKIRVSRVWGITIATPQHAPASDLARCIVVHVIDVLFVFGNYNKFVVKVPEKFDKLTSPEVFNWLVARKDGNILGCSAKFGYKLQG